MEPRIIKTEEQYRRYLAEVERLAALDPDPQSDDGARLELLAKLVEDYEKELFSFEKPDPVDAILFRMEQRGLRRKDVAHLLGGKNRASEVLSRKRPLTLSMIRALHEHLQIPAELLIAESTPKSSLLPSKTSLESTAHLVVKRGWTPTMSAARSMLAQLMDSPLGSPAFLKHTLTFGREGKTDLTNVWLWLARVREVAETRSDVLSRFQEGVLNEDLIRYVVRLSWHPDGPTAARRFLEDRGIVVVIEPHLPATHIDGAALLSSQGTPIIGLTVREDRLDNFWFTLAHELVHAWKHLDPERYRAIADLQLEKGERNEVIEREANTLAAEILIPRAIWKRSVAHLRPSADAIKALAAQLQISPAIVAGRVRYERKNYSLYADLVGYRKVRHQFPDVRWA